jgi:SPP1 gp7 family putative phage head morphogenesis protein
VAEIEAMLKAVGSDVSLVSKLNLQAFVKRVAGVDPLLLDKPLAARMALFRKSNVDLIRTIDQRYFSEIDGIVSRGMAAGTRPETMAKDIEARYGVSEARAKLIARDQTAKLNGQLDQARQTDLGVTRYVWQSSVDERVRPTHAERDGEIFFWSDPPGDMDDPADGGHPGTPIACRCVSLPILSDVLDALEAE